jgi:hypothetical protein
VGYGSRERTPNFSPSHATHASAIGIWLGGFPIALASASPNLWLCKWAQHKGCRLAAKLPWSRIFSLHTFELSSQMSWILHQCLVNAGADARRPRMRAVGGSAPWRPVKQSSHSQTQRSKWEHEI